MSDGMACNCAPNVGLAGEILRWADGSAVKVCVFENEPRPDSFDKVEAIDAVAFDEWIESLGVELLAA